MFLAFLLACPHPPAPTPVAWVQTGGPEVPTPAPAPEGALAPRLFDAAALRAGLPLGTWIRLRVQVAGGPTVEQRWDFVAVSEAGATIRSRVYGTDGTLLTDEGAGESAWSELEQHASFPAARTVREEGSVTVPAGRFDTWNYTVIGTEAEGGRDFVKRYAFAKTLPGPPVS
jgi:hypothetical protein